MKNLQPNAEQKEWREQVRHTGSIISGARYGDWPIEVHHVEGRAAKVKGVGNIGHWNILPLTKGQHAQIDLGHKGLTNLKSEYIFHHGETDILDLTLKEFQKFLFTELCKKPPLCRMIDGPIYDAILAYHK